MPCLYTHLHSWKQFVYSFKRKANVLKWNDKSGKYIVTQCHKMVNQFVCIKCENKASCDFQDDSEARAKTDSLQSRTKGYFVSICWYIIYILKKNSWYDRNIKKNTLLFTSDSYEGSRNIESTRRYFAVYRPWQCQVN